MEMQSLFKGIDERYENIVLFFPLYQIRQYGKEQYKKYKTMEIALSIMLYILEKMLTDTGSVSNGQLTRFIQQLMKQRYDVSMSHEDADEFRKYMVDDKLRNGGKKFTFPFTDDEGSDKTIAFDLIQNEKWSRDKSEVRLVLTEKGIEMLFKTKEMYSEMQITVTMLYFKQQLEKGSFSPALNAAKELLFQIDQQRKSIKATTEQIKRNALSSFNQQKLERQLNNSFAQTKQERKQLIELDGEIDKVKSNYQGGNLSKKEEEAYDTILNIDRVINKSMAQHELLLGEKEDLLANLTKSFQMLLDNVFSKQFNIEREIIDQWILQKVTEEKAGVFLKPVMPYHKPRVYHPFSIFDPQTVRRKVGKSEEEVTEIDPEVAEAHRKEQERIKQAKHVKNLNVLRVILMPLLHKNQYFISDVLHELRNNDLKKYSRLVQESMDEFLSLSVQLHRLKGKKFERIPKDELPFVADLTKMMHDLTKEEPNLLDVGVFELLATEKHICFANGETMTDYVIKRKEETEYGTF